MRINRTHTFKSLNFHVSLFSLLVFFCPLGQKIKPMFADVTSPWMNRPIGGARGHIPSELLLPGWTQPSLPLSFSWDWDLPPSAGLWAEPDLLRVETSDWTILDDVGHIRRTQPLLFLSDAIVLAVRSATPLFFFFEDCRS